MKVLKREILFVLLFMVIGIAAITTNVVVNMSTPINQNPDDFLVYFSKALVDSSSNDVAIKNERTIVFSGILSELGDKRIVDYDITNASKLYDAQVSINCSESSDYLTIVNDFDTDELLIARSTRSGQLTIQLTKSYTGEVVSEEVTCIMSANAVERESSVTTDVSAPLEEKMAIGDIVSYRGENFYVITQDTNTVSLLTEYTLGTDYRQSSEENNVMFSDTNGWDTGTEIDIQAYDGPAKTYVNEYVSYLQTATNDTTLSGDLITTALLGDPLGCDIENYTCSNSKYVDWLMMDQAWWTKSAYGTNGIKRLFGEAIINGNYFGANTSGIRPVITVSKATLDNMINEPQTVCEAEGWDYSMDTGTNYKCSNDPDFSSSCSYTYEGVSTGGCGSSEPQ